MAARSVVALCYSSSKRRKHLLIDSLQRGAAQASRLEKRKKTKRTKARLGWRTPTPGPLEAGVAS